MVSTHEIDALQDLADQSPWRLPDGGWVVIRAEMTDVTPQTPHGLDYALVAQDSDKQRVLGFDNSHGYDDAPDEAPFDHEHPFGRVDRRIPYAFRSVGDLISDFFNRCEAYCETKGMAFDLKPERGQ